MQQLPIREVNFNDIQLNAHGLSNGRTSLGDLSDLQLSIEDNGLLTPPVVWDIEDDLVLVAGYRRHASIAKIREEVETAFDQINVSIFTGTPEEAQAKNLEENIQRKDLNPADEAEAVTKLYERIGDQTDVGKLVGKSQGWVSQQVNLFRGLIQRGLEYLRDGRINRTIARRISQLLTDEGTPDIDEQNRVLDEIDAGNENVRINRKRNKTYRTKKEFEELALELVKAADEETVDPQHAAVLGRCIAWHRCEIEVSALIHDQPELDDDEGELDEDDLVDAEEIIRARAAEIRLEG